MKPNKNILGGVFSGKIEKTGKDVNRFKVGDEVFGTTGMSFGAYAEYICLPENGTIAIKPDKISHIEAAAIPFGRITALYFIKKANNQPGQKVLIYGASGAFGIAAMQLAKYFKANDTGVCSTQYPFCMCCTSNVRGRSSNFGMGCSAGNSSVCL